MTADHAAVDRPAKPRQIVIDSTLEHATITAAFIQGVVRREDDSSHHERSSTMPDVQVKPEDVVPGKVIYQNSAQGGMIQVRVQLSRTATVSIKSETGAHGEGDCDASHTLLVNGEQMDKVTAVPRFQDWNGTVGAVVVFEAMKWYEVKGVQWNNNATPINTGIELTIVLK